MRVIKAKKGLTPEQKKEIKTLLLSGGLIVYPTETAYGLGGDAFNKDVINKVRRLKKRNKQKPLPVICGSVIIAQTIAIFNNSAKDLAKKFWPGPLTLVLPVQHSHTGEYESAISLLTSTQKTIALRVSSNTIARELSRLIKAPIISTSANLSGQGECYSVFCVLKQLGRNKPDLIIDAGRLPKKPPSTIVDCTVKPPKVLRQGGIAISDNKGPHPLVSRKQ